MDTIPYALLLKNAIKSSRIDLKSMRAEAQMGTCAVHSVARYFQVVTTFKSKFADFIK